MTFDPHRAGESLWAPRAQHVELEVGGQRHALCRGPEGWWFADAPPTAPYRFVVDGTAIPDPRSCNQPDGLDGPSAPLQPHTWTDGEWRGRPLHDAVIYEMHVGTFTPEGTFDSAIEGLDHLVALGIDAVEVMPVATFPGRHGWGYDGVLLYAVHGAYGGPDAMRRFVDACHARGIAVVLDVVYNHLGPTGNHLSLLGPYFTDKRSTPWGSAVNLDQPGSAFVRRFLVENALMWIEHFHVDGLRLDAVHALCDDSDEHLVAQISREVGELAQRLGRAVWVTAESDANDPALVDRLPQGQGLDAVWDDDVHHAIHVALTGEHEGYYVDFSGWEDLQRALVRGFVFDGRLSVSAGRPRGAPYGERPRRHLIVCTQNHDQVGNRAAGERLCHLVDRRAAQAAAALVLTSPFLPLLFQGEEWAASTPFLYFTDHTDPGIARAVTEGRTAEFAGFSSFAANVPDPQDPTTLRRSILDWSERTEGDHAEMLRWYTALIALRRSHPALRTDGPDDTLATYDAASGAFSVLRGSPAGPQVLVVVSTRRVPLLLEPVVRASRMLLTNDDAMDPSGAGTLSPGCVLIAEVPAR